MAHFFKKNYIKLNLKPIFAYLQSDEEASKTFPTSTVMLQNDSGFFSKNLFRRHGNKI